MTEYSVSLNADFCGRNCVLEESLNVIQQEKKDLTVEYWVEKLESKINLFNKIEAHLHLNKTSSHAYEWLIFNINTVLLLKNEGLNI
jgi:hypothetical protein